jgi:nucleoside permease NupC
MPTLIFFSSVINVLYYIGAVQYFIVKMGFLVNFLMGTSMTESINATANIFIGQAGKILTFSYSNIKFKNKFFKLRGPHTNKTFFTKNDE